MENKDPNFQLTGINTMEYPKKMLIKKVVIVILGLTAITGVMYLYVTKISSYKNGNTQLLTPVSEDSQSKENDQYKNPFKILENEPINILLLGIDRRSKIEASYRTDIMILLSINPKDNTALLISAPRDLWYDGERLNATYISGGWENLQAAFEEITGLKPAKFILTDFEDFSWLVDSMGGVPVNVERSFVDSSYPVDITKTYQTISFNEGEELLTGERALIYARSRKGTNSEGSDWARMRRQHLILKGMLDAVLQPKSIFNPMNVEKAYKLVTENRMDTNLSLEDTYYLWDFYKDKDKYVIKSLFLDTNYLYTPPMEDYGGAWVLVPNDGSYETFKKDVTNALYNLETPFETLNNTSENNFSEQL